MALAGALGGLAGFTIAGPLLMPFFDYSLDSEDGYFRQWLGQAMLLMVNGLAMSTAILIADNHLSLRGRWNRDVLRGLPTLALAAFGGGALGQFVYSSVGISRAVAWAIGGIAVGYSIGYLRNDAVQAKRAALGGAIGGGISGVLVDLFLLVSYTDSAFFSASLLGTVITGALIGLFMRLIQDALKTAWLVGISTGPYEGKQYLLNTERVTVGSSELHDISLYRASEIKVPTGVLQYKNREWRWIGEAVDINDAPQTDAPLTSGDSIKLGAANFRFHTKSEAKVYVAPLQPAPARQAPPQPTPATPSGGQWLLQGAQVTTPLPSPPARVTIGRDPANDIVLTDPSVSSRHAVIDVGPGQLNITDTNSTNGVTVNGVRSPVGIPVALQDGSSVVLGQQELWVRQTSAIPTGQP